ncbi:hypothetical protein [Streptomyces sp. NRRL S-4]|uniref:hypothetical protein n=1 Tax=Streptomyces sp. NRRL S-4 TaxID=1519471 RepID=UPI0006B4BD64|nr:hypothetical protein [Streptomyces sp. NRRL S-4]KPC79530.1 hypothetical protein ADK82_25710 [Streptomyces sp. NRRL S-4]
MYSYTAAESRERRKLFRRGFHQAIGDNLDPAVTRRMHEIDAKAAERGARELAALQSKTDADRQAVADAKAAVRTSKWGPDRAAARDVLRAAEKQLRRSERVLHRAEQS